MSCDTSYVLVPDTQVTAPRLIHSRGNSSGTHLSVQRQTNLTGGGELAKVSQLLSFSRWFSKRNMHDFIFSYLPMGCYFRSSATCRKASVESSYVYLGDYRARIMKFVELRLELRCRKEQREDVSEPCLEWMVTPSTVLIICFGLLASLGSWGIVFKMFWSLELLCLHFWSVSDSSANLLFVWNWVCFNRFVSLHIAWFWNK